MNGKTTFWTGVIAGACIGALVSLFNKDARHYGKSLLDETNVRLSGYVRNPEETVQKVKQSVTSFNEIVSENTDSALHALNQIEQTVNKFTK